MDRNYYPNSGLGLASSSSGKTGTSPAVTSGSLYGQRTSTAQSTFPTATGSPSLFGLISEVNKGILKQPKKGILKNSSSQPNVIKEHKEDVFLAAKSRIEQIQMGLWNSSTESSLSDQNVSDSGSKKEKVFKIPQVLPTSRGKHSVQDKSKSPGTFNPVSKPVTSSSNIYGSYKPNNQPKLISLVDYADDETISDSHTSDSSLTNKYSQDSSFSRKYTTDATPSPGFSLESSRSSQMALDSLPANQYTPDRALKELDMYMAVRTPSSQSTKFHEEKGNQGLERGQYYYENSKEDQMNTRSYDRDYGSKTTTPRFEGHQSEDVAYNSAHRIKDGNERNSTTSSYDYDHKKSLGRYSGSQTSGLKDHASEPNYIEKYVDDRDYSYRKDQQKKVGEYTDKRRSRFDDVSNETRSSGQREYRDIDRTYSDRKESPPSSDYRFRGSYRGFKESERTEFRPDYKIGTSQSYRDIESQRYTGSGRIYNEDRGNDGVKEYDHGSDRNRAFDYKRELDRGIDGRSDRAFDSSSVTVGKDISGQYDVTSSYNCRDNSITGSSSAHTFRTRQRSGNSTSWYGDRGADRGYSKDYGSMEDLSRQRHDYKDERSKLTDSKIGQSRDAEYISMQGKDTYASRSSDDNWYHKSQMASYSGSDRNLRDESPSKYGSSTEQESSELYRWDEEEEEEEESKGESEFAHNSENKLEKSKNEEPEMYEDYLFGTMDMSDEDNDDLGFSRSGTEVNMPKEETVSSKSTGTDKPSVGFTCKDCNITCADQTVYDVHLQSDAHVLTLQRKAQELFQMPDSCDRKSRFDINDLGQPLVVGGIQPPGLAVSPSPRIQVIPPKPQGPLEANNVRATRLRLFWRLLTQVEEDMIDKYVVEYRNARETHWVNVGNTKEHEYVIDGLQDKTDYLFRVSSINGQEKSEFLESILITTAKREGSLYRRRSRSKERLSTRSRQNDRKRSRSIEKKMLDGKRQSQQEKRKRSDSNERKTSTESIDKDKKIEEFEEITDVEITEITRQMKIWSEREIKKEKPGNTQSKVNERLECQLYELIMKYQDPPLLGLDHVYEIVSYNPVIPTCYNCKLCNNKGSGDIIMRHICGLPHRMACIKQYNLVLFDAIEMLATRKEKMAKVSKEAKIIEDKVGRGSVNVMRMLNPSDHNGKYIFKSPVPVKAPRTTRPKAQEEDTVKETDEEKEPEGSEFSKLYAAALEAGALPDKAIVGLSHVKECLHPKKTDLPKYVCSLCKCCLSHGTILFHLIGKKHRMTYLKAYHTTLHDKLSKNSNFKKELPTLAAELHEQYGMGEVQVVNAKTDRMWRARNKDKIIGEAMKQESQEATMKQLGLDVTQAVKFGIKTTDDQPNSLIKTNVFEAATKQSSKDILDWTKENEALQAKIQNQSIIKSTRKSKFLSVYSGNFSRYPTIGMQWVTEFQKPDPKADPWFMCFMCQQKIQWKNIINHVTSTAHRFNYLKTNYKDLSNLLYEKIGNSKTGMRYHVEAYTQKVISIEGHPKEVEVMIELNINTEALISVMKVKDNTKSLTEAPCASGIVTSTVEAPLSQTIMSGSTIQVAAQPDPSLVASTPSLQQLGQTFPPLSTECVASQVPHNSGIMIGPNLPVVSSASQQSIPSLFQINPTLVTQSWQTAQSFVPPLSVPVHQTPSSQNPQNSESWSRMRGTHINQQFDAETMQPDLSLLQANMNTTSLIHMNTPSLIKMNTTSSMNQTSSNVINPIHNNPVMNTSSIDNVIQRHAENALTQQILTTGQFPQEGMVVTSQDMVNDGGYDAESSAHNSGGDFLSGSHDLDYSQHNVYPDRRKRSSSRDRNEEINKRFKGEDAFISDEVIPNIYDIITRRLDDLESREGSRSPSQKSGESQDDSDRKGRDRQSVSSRDGGKDRDGDKQDEGRDRTNKDSRQRRGSKDRYRDRNSAGRDRKERTPRRDKGSDRSRPGRDVSRNDDRMDIDKPRKDREAERNKGREREGRYSDREGRYNDRQSESRSSGKTDDEGRNRSRIDRKGRYNVKQIESRSSGKTDNEGRNRSRIDREGRYNDRQSESRISDNNDNEGRNNNRTDREGRYNDRQSESRSSCNTDNEGRNSGRTDREGRNSEKESRGRYIDGVKRSSLEPDSRRNDRNASDSKGIRQERGFGQANSNSGSHVRLHQQFEMENDDFLQDNYKGDNEQYYGNNFTDNYEFGTNINIMEQDFESRGLNMDFRLELDGMGKKFESSKNLEVGSRNTRGFGNGTRGRTSGMPSVLNTNFGTQSGAGAGAVKGDGLLGERPAVMPLMGNYNTLGVNLTMEGVSSVIGQGVNLRRSGRPSRFSDAATSIQGTTTTHSGRYSDQFNNENVLFGDSFEEKDYRDIDDEMPDPTREEIENLLKKAPKDNPNPTRYEIENLMQKAKNLMNIIETMDGEEQPSDQYIMDDSNMSMLPFPVRGRGAQRGRGLMPQRGQISDRGFSRGNSGPGRGFSRGQRGGIMMRGGFNIGRGNVQFMPFRGRGNFRGN